MGTYSPPGAAPVRARLSALAGDPARARAWLVLAFGLGLVIGWVGLGWYVFPVKWTDTTPADLRADARQTYVQLVAESFGREPNLDIARQRMGWLEPAQQAADLAAVAGNAAFPAAQTAARDLGAALGLDLAAAAAAAAATVPATTPGAAPAAPEAEGGDLVAALRSLAWWALIAALGAALALAIVWGWMQRRAARAAGAGRDIPPQMDEGWDWDVPQAAPSAPLGMPTEALAVPAAASSMAATTAPATYAGSSTSSTARRRGQSAPAWRPARVALGQTVRAEYDAQSAPAIQSWLVYNQRGGLEGGAGLLARPVGEVNTLDIWFSDRDDVDQTTKTPKVTLISQAAYNDPVLRAWLADRRLVPAVPGQTVALETTDLALDVRVESVEPPPDADTPSLTSVILALTPRRLRSGAALAEPTGTAGHDWNEPSDDDEDGAGAGFDPPRPLPFRRD